MAKINSGQFTTNDERTKRLAAKGGRMSHGGGRGRKTETA